MSEPTPARYRTTNWSSYTASLRKRRSLLIWLDKDMTWLAPHDGSAGRPAVFSDAAIRFCLTIKGEGRPEIRRSTDFGPERVEPRDGSSCRSGRRPGWWPVC